MKVERIARYVVNTPLMSPSRTFRAYNVQYIGEESDLLFNSYANLGFLGRVCDSVTKFRAFAGS